MSHLNIMFLVSLIRSSLEFAAKHSEIRRAMDQSEIATGRIDQSLARPRINDLVNDQLEESQIQQKHITPFSKEAVQSFSARSQFSTGLYHSRFALFDLYIINI